MEHIKTILFDLDGTLLPLKSDQFEHAYLGSVTQFTKHIVEPKQLINALWNGTSKMIASKDAAMSNKEVFYKSFVDDLGVDLVAQLEDVLDDYYNSDFEVVKDYTYVCSLMVESVAYLKGKGYDLILATNPLFPKLATDKRIEWAGLELDDFIDITRFEKNHYCKPNLEYYEEIMHSNNLDPKTCLMVGNDVEEDLVAAKLGMKTFLITDDLIHRGDDVSCDWQGSRLEFLEKIKEVF